MVERVGKRIAIAERRERAPEVYVIGGTGLVGSGFSSENYRRVGRSSVDVTNRESVLRCFEREQPQTVILAAGYTDVDGAEREPEEALRINVLGAWNVARACEQFGSHLIFVSSDFVFPGTEEYPGPYLESSLPPAFSGKRGVYGTSKYLGEQHVRYSGARSAIVRIAYPFGVGGERDFMVKTLGILKAGYPLFEDQKITPTYLPDLQRAVKVIQERQLTGVFHVTCNLLTPRQLGLHLKRRLALELEVKRGSLEEFLQRSGRISPRPVLGGLRTLGTQKKLGIEFSYWQNKVDEMIEEGLLAP